MFLVDPPPTRGDLHFSVAGFPVRVSPFFWLVALLLAGGFGSRLDPKFAAIWIGTVFVSILIHELGHAVVMRKYGGAPRIVLYHFGGLAIEERIVRSSREQIAISAAGPLAGFVFAALIVLLITLAGQPWEVVGIGGTPSLNGFGVPLLVGHFVFQDFTSPNLNDLIFSLLSVNILWGLLNLAPVYPLDGGQIAREVLTEMDPAEGVARSLWVSTITGGILAVIALITSRSLLLPLMFGMLAYSSYNTLQRYQGSRYDRY